MQDNKTEKGLLKQETVRIENGPGKELRSLGESVII